MKSVRESPCGTTSKREVCCMYACTWQVEQAKASERIAELQRDLDRLTDFRKKKEQIEVHTCAYARALTCAHIYEHARTHSLTPHPISALEMKEPAAVGDMSS